MYNIPLLTIPALDTAQGKVRLPGSKSISNRALLLAALCQGKTTINGLLDSDDTRVMLTALRTLGCTIEFLSETTVCVLGIAGQVKSAEDEVQKLFLGNAGTAMRPLVAALALMPGRYELRGVSRMHERPIADLVDALRGFGCNIHYLEKTGFPPLCLEHMPSNVLAKPTERVTRVRGDVSSQFLTALLLALPLASQTQDRVIEVQGELISKPYIEITLNLLAQFGIAVRRHKWQRFVIPAGSRYQSPKEINIEPDASSASYFIALGTLASEQGIVIEGLGPESIQGDIRFIEAAQAMGAKIEVQTNSLHITRGSWPLKAIDLDCNHIPDAAMTLAVMALFAQGCTRLRNIASWRVKETDRLSAMATELRKLGASVEEGEDFLSITPPSNHGWQSASIQTYDDHRMAMCFALAAFNPQHLPVHIEEPQCVAKTFPDYFETLFALSQSRCEHIPVITVDGPSASGKGTLATLLAQTLGFHYLDSGALYRLTALWALRSGVALEDEIGLARLAKTLPARFAFPCVYLNEKEVSAALREETIGKAASSIASLPKVRAALTELQRSFRKIPGLVCDGRDMGSIIFPDANLKIHLVADAKARARRRFEQIVEHGGAAIMEDLVADLEARDARDQSRDVAPLSVAKGASLLDNSHLSVQKSLQYVLDLWQAYISCRQPITATKRDVVGDGV